MSLLTKIYIVFSFLGASGLEINSEILFKKHCPFFLAEPRSAVGRAPDS